ncbi:hypothetical protein Tco_0821800 [Tanacetum coccineum]|uniref:Uncharacterized protein n=1 Tax=Tanacetum coccineum TaxID=301880 RepID=A0ABQ5AHG9_9ASTR
MITTNNSIKDKKPSRLMLLPMGILETFPCVKDVDYITRDLAVSSVRIMSTPEYIYPIIILSDIDVEDTFSSTHSPDYILALSDYSLASPRNTSPNSLDDLTKDLLSSLSISPFHDDLHILKFSVISCNVITRKHTRIYTIPNDFSTTRVAQQKLGRPITYRFHKSKYSIHPGSDKIYQDLEKFYWLSSRGVVLEISRRVK